MANTAGNGTDAGSGNTIDVPSQYQTYVNTAATALGLPVSIVAAQIQLESDFNPNALSPGGAEGIAQFEPKTFAEYGSGSPYNVSDAFAAYINYMGTLLTQEKGSVYDALEAYNAGPGNLSAGASYASDIFDKAGLFTTLQQGGSGQIGSIGTAAGEGGQGIAGETPGQAAGSWTNDLGSVYQGVTGALFDWPAQFVGVATDIDNFAADAYHSYQLFFQPKTYVRIGAAIFGFVFIIIGIVFIAREAKPAA